MRWLSIWLAFLAGSFVARPALAQSRAAPLRLGEYKRAVHTARVSLDRFAHAPSGTSVVQLKRMLQRLDRVRLPDGRMLTTDTPRLAGELAPDNPASLRDAAHQLDALDDALHGSSLSRSNLRALSELDTVLRDPRFHPQPNLWERFNDWLRSFVIRILFRLLFTTVVNPALGWILGGAFLVLLVGIVFLAARGALGRMVVDVASARTAEQGMRSVAAGERARQEAAAGDYRAALRYLFLATMLALQERGALELRPGLTNHEYLALVRSAATSTPGHAVGDAVSLQQLVEEFDRTWYGHRPFDAAGFARCEDLARRVLGAVPARPAA